MSIDFPSTLEPIDTSDMIAIHAVFRDAFGSAESHVARVADDATQAALISTYYANILALLQVHHDGEDKLLWPKLTARRPEAAELFASMQAQHAQVHGATATAATALAGWTNDRNPATTQAFVTALTGVYEQLVPHLDQEERDILPIAAEALTGPEWGALPSHGLQHFSGDKLWLILGLIREKMSPEALDLMDAHMPPPAVEFWATAGQSMFDGFIAQIR
jgi:hypothetical protein